MVVNAGPGMILVFRPWRDTLRPYPLYLSPTWRYHVSTLGWDHGHVADSDAVRSRRKRQHAQGDHSFCTRRCEAARVPLKIADFPAASAGDFDPMAAMAELAQGLLAAWQADPGNAMLARECRQTLLVLPGARDTDVQDEMSALIRSLSVPVRSEPPYPAGWRGTEVDGPPSDTG